MDRQVDRRDRAEVTRLSVGTVALQAAAVEGKVEHCARDKPPVIKTPTA